MRLKALLLVVVVFASVLVLPAQEPAPGPGQGQPAPQPTPQPTPGREPGPGTQPQPGRETQPRFPTDDRNDPFNRGGRGISGKIVPSPSTRMRVDLYVDSIRLDTTYTDMDGTFRFERQQPGRRYEIHVDMGPNLEYVEEVDFTFGQPMIHIRNQGIRRTGPGSENAPGGGTLISLASLSVPKNARKEFENGQKAMGKKNFDEALLRLGKATELYPKYAEAYNTMGMAYRNMNKPEDAQKAFEQAITADPAWLNSYMNLGYLQLASNQYEQLLDTSSKALKLHPTLSQAHFLQSVAHLYLGRLDAAEKSALEADRHAHEQVPQLHLVLATIYQNKGSQPDRVKHLRAFLKEAPNASNAAKVKAELEQLKEK